MSKRTTNGRNTKQSSMFLATQPQTLLLKPSVWLVTFVQQLHSLSLLFAAYATSHRTVRHYSIITVVFKIIKTCNRIVCMGIIQHSQSRIYYRGSSCVPTNMWPVKREGDKYSLAYKKKGPLSSPLLQRFCSSLNLVASFMIWLNSNFHEGLLIFINFYFIYDQYLMKLRGKLCD